MASPPIETIYAAYQRRTDYALDNYTLVTGDWGMWKSLWARKFTAKVSARKLTVDHIHFTQEEWNQDFVTLRPGDGLIMDEWRAHKRLAMHGFRQEQLDTNKEGRQIGSNATFCYPDAGEIDGDLLKRFEWWHHKPDRGTVVIRRKVSKLIFTPDGKPLTDVKWPKVGRYPVTGKNDPLRVPYEAKKDDRMRDRRARLLENDQDAQPVAPTSGVELRPKRYPPGLLDLVQAELKR